MAMMKRMLDCINQLEAISGSIADVAKLLRTYLNDDNTSEEPEATSKPEEKTATPTITHEEVRGVLATKSRAGYTMQVQALLQKYGAAKLSQVDPKNYVDIIREAGGIGIG